MQLICIKQRAQFQVWVGVFSSQDNYFFHCLWNCGKKNKSNVAKRGLYLCQQRYASLQGSKCCATNWATSQSAHFALVIEYVGSIHPWANSRCWISQSERTLWFSYIIINFISHTVSIANILYVPVLTLLLHTYFILFIYFLGDISISLAILNSRLNKGLLLLLLRGEKLNYNSCTSLLLRKSQNLLFLAPEVQWTSKCTVFVRFTFPLNDSNHVHIWCVAWPQ